MSGYQRASDRAVWSGRMLALDQKEVLRAELYRSLRCGFVKVAELSTGEATKIVVHYGLTHLTSKYCPAANRRVVKVTIAVAVQVSGILIRVLLFGKKFSYRDLVIASVRGAATAELHTFLSRLREKPQMAQFMNSRRFAKTLNSLILVL